MSTPVTSSVTGCSTWIRPFSSSRKKSRPSSMNSTVPALRYPIARAKVTAASAAAGRGLHDEREAELARLALLDDGHARVTRDPLGRELVSAGAQRLGRRPDEDEARRLDRPCELRALREKPVPGMDGVGAGL